MKGGAWKKKNGGKDWDWEKGGGGKWKKNKMGYNCCIVLPSKVCILHLLLNLP